MKIIFFGSSDFAVAGFNAIFNSGHKIVGVVTQPDKKRGRHLLAAPTAIKKTALEHGLDVFQPETISSAASIKFLSQINPDLLVVIAYGQILPATILKIPKLFAVNLHASLLPKYRGAAPINWAIINGEEESGLTVIKMSERLDAGEIISQKKVKINTQDDALTLEKKFEQEGARLLVETLDKIETKDVSFLPQESSKATLAPKLKKSDGQINWESEAIKILNLIRGTAGWPGAHTYYNGKMLKILKAHIVTDYLDVEKKSMPGQVVEANKSNLLIATANQYLAIDLLHPENKRIMNVQDFLAGHKLKNGDIIG